MPNFEQYIKNLPKGELHVHLNGLVSHKLIKQIIEVENIRVPDGLNLDTDLIITSPCQSLEEYLKPWEVLRLIPNNRKNLKLLVENAYQNLKKDNINFVEIRNSILYLALINDITVKTALNWLIEDIEFYSEKFNIKSGLIMTIPRGDSCYDHLQSLCKAYDMLGKPNMVLGLDLAGNEEIQISEDLGKEFMRYKEKYDFKITIHAGETGNIKNIIDAVNKFGADRIGHGTAAAYCEETMELLKDKDICLEICPISNRLSNAVKDGYRHPVIEFIKHDVPFVICSDNPGIHKSPLSNDYTAFLEEYDNKVIIDGMYDKQKQYSFIKELK